MGKASFQAAEVGVAGFKVGWAVEWWSGACAGAGARVGK